MNNFKSSYIVIALGVVFAFVIFVLFVSEHIYLYYETGFFNTAIAIGCTAMISMFISIILSNKKNFTSLKKAYLNGGNLALIGSVDMQLSAFITSLYLNYSSILFYIGMAILTFFFTLLLGGIICFIYTFLKSQKSL